MANSLCFTHLTAFQFQPTNKPGLIINNPTAGKVLWINSISHNSQNAKFHSLEAKATGSNQGTEPNSLVCANCDGNGAVVCSQCKGNGVNSVDHFNGQFKAGGLCWLCRGKKDILCGDCNGAGFLGGFMSTFDE
ncbi:protein BUNDLE SHEATH DEFECTIVE 2, chloroplastic-like [Cornus florida]|uniref:protein BUNDLE SHEATH DEFECTIVE 2, chloroplastic-like n=1 Tax=Cornus florida TaxID=4283 RepID=UPI0028986F32|nr:protein BUNDLE SHEATH DEFECTIVE 2, chloroplastic-like [Cornus florida]